jgi:hypothetical protein
MDLELLGSKGEFSILVPTKPFRLCVSAAVYEACCHGSDGPKEQATPILLALGDDQRFHNHAGCLLLKSVKALMVCSVYTRRWAMEC